MSRFMGLLSSTAVALLLRLSRACSLGTTGHAGRDQHLSRIKRCVLAFA